MVPMFRLAAKHVVIDAKPIETKGYIQPTTTTTCVNDITELFYPSILYKGKVLRSFSHMSASLEK